MLSVSVAGCRRVQISNLSDGSSVFLNENGEPDCCKLFRKVQKHSVSYHYLGNCVIILMVSLGN